MHQTLAVYIILWKVNLCLHQTHRGILEPVPDSVEILFVMDMKILGGGVGRRTKIHLLL